MIRLVVTYSVGDGCTYSCEVVEPITYESAEHAIVDFEDQARAAYLAEEPFFFFGGKQFYPENFFERDGSEHRSKVPYYGPLFQTVDEWFGQKA